MKETDTLHIHFFLPADTLAYPDCMDFSTYQDTFLPSLASQLTATAVGAWLAFFGVGVATATTLDSRTARHVLTGVASLVSAVLVFLFVAVAPWFPRPAEWLGEEIRETYGMELSSSTLERMSIAVSTSSEDGMFSGDLGAAEVFRSVPAQAPVGSIAMRDILDHELLEPDATYFGPFKNYPNQEDFLVLQHSVENGWQLMKVLLVDENGEAFPAGVLEEFPRVTQP